MENHKLIFLSPIDGRYAKITKTLRTHFSEFAYIRNRAQVEIDYLIALSQNLQIIRPLNKEELDFLNTLKEDFSLEDAERIKEI